MDMTSAPSRILMRASLSAAAIGVILWPAMWNGFPIVYDDDSVYLAFPDTILAAMPQLYSVFLWAMAQFASLPAAVVFQSIIAVGVVHVAFTRLTPLSSSRSILATLLLGALTQLPWLVSQITPDFMGGLGVLAIIVFMLKPGRIWGDVFLLLVAVIACLVSTANILVILPLAAALALLRQRVAHPSLDWKAGISLALLIILGMGPQYLFNAAVVDKPALAIGSSARLFSKLTDHGLAGPYLEQACTKGETAACPVAAQIRHFTEREQFLWGTGADETGPVDHFAAWEDYDGTFERWARGILIENPVRALGAGLSDAAELTTRLTLSPDTQDHVSHVRKGDSVRYRIETHHPDELRAFLTARQQQGMLTSAFPALFYQVTTLASYAGLLAALAAAIIRRDTVLTTLCVSIAMALIWSTLVHGGLSAPIPRYTVKCSWLAMFAVFAWWAKTANKTSISSGSDPA